MGKSHYYCKFFHVTLQAPHGGIFVLFFTTNHALLYLLSILIGAVVTALILGVLKKPVPTEK
ncbi:hypothetical protein DT075_22475 [Bacillus licheniformis]|nr:hypothetical protein DT075_22475 [Bacillus licheniformis]